MDPMHPDLAPLAFLIGAWKGRGKGCYPTIEPFEYFEEATYSPGPGKPFIAYSQRTRRAGDDGEPLHSETGYIRLAGRGKVELVIAQPTGIVEVHTGEVQGERVDFETSLVGLSGTAVEVSQARRELDVEGDTMRYQLRMAAVGQRMQVHLEAELARIRQTRSRILLVRSRRECRPDERTRDFVRLLFSPPRHRIPCPTNPSNPLLRTVDDAVHVRGGHVGRRSP